MAIALRQQVLGRAVARPVVDEDEAVDAGLAVIAQEVRQPQRLVLDLADESDLARFVWDWPHIQATHHMRLPRLHAACLSLAGAMSVARIDADVVDLEET